MIHSDLLGHQLEHTQRLENKTERKKLVNMRRSKYLTEPNDMLHMIQYINVNDIHKQSNCHMNTGENLPTTPLMWTINEPTTTVHEQGR